MGRDGMGTRIVGGQARAYRPGQGADFTARYYRAQGQAHEYRKSELADPSFTRLTPLCEIFQPEPQTHDRADLDNQPLAKHSPFQVHGLCREMRCYLEQESPS